MALIVGFVFVVRDFAQREVGHRVLLAMLAGAAAKLERIDAETVRRAHREVIQTTMVAV